MWPRAAHFLREICLIVAIVLAARTAVAEPYYVPSGSMEPTLAVGDRLLVDKFAYGFSRYSLPSIPGIPAIFPHRAQRLFGNLPERGDIVVFRLPRDPDLAFVKRVIGLPGDRVRLAGGNLWLNGEQIPLRSEGEDSLTEALPNGREHQVFERFGWGQYDDMHEMEVPEGHLFVMGDNRDDSLDSRVAPSLGGVGLVPVENLVGRVDLVLASWELGITSRPLGEWPDAIRFQRFFSRVQ